MGTITVTVAGARGGQGTTTVAAALALFGAGHTDTELVAVEPAATAALLGLAPSSAFPVEVSAGLRLSDVPTGTPGLRIHDVGRLRDAGALEGDIRLVVLRGPCYLALRELVAVGNQSIDGLVLLGESGRALGAREVVDVVGVPIVANVPIELDVAKMIDAGLFAARLHSLGGFEQLRRYLTTFLVPPGGPGA